MSDRRRGVRAAAGALAAVVGAVVLLAGVLGTTAGPAGAATPKAGRVLIVSLPDTEWADFEHASTPTSIACSRRPRSGGW